MPRGWDDDVSGDDDGNDDKTSTTNVIVMSEAGKPIFFRHGNEEEVSRICALLQSLRSSVLYNRTFGDSMGDISSISSGTYRIVFMPIQSLTLIAICHMDDAGHDEVNSTAAATTSTTTEAYLRLQLEYVYSLIVLAFTDHLQTILKHDPSYDLRSVLDKTTESSIRDFLDESDGGKIISESNNSNNSHYSPAPFLTGGARTFFPLSASVRDRTSKVLQSVGDATENTVFALLFSDRKLITLVQPLFRPHQFRVSDLHLLMNIVARQHRRHQSSGGGSSSNSEMWLPVCLPRFNKAGFLHCYTSCLDPKTNTVLALVSQSGTTEQFKTFQGAATKIRWELGLTADGGRTSSPSVLEILNSDTSFENSRGAAAATTTTTTKADAVADDVEWTRRTPRSTAEESASHNSDDDWHYVDASGGGDCDSGDGTPPSPPELLTEITSVTGSKKDEVLLNEYLDVAGALHFVFRLDVPMRQHHHHASGRKQPRNNELQQQQTAIGGHFPQCISSPVRFPFTSTKSRRRLWSMYQKLNLRIRLGSATVESTMDAFDMISRHNDGGTGSTTATPGIGCDCPAMCLVESPPNVQGVTYFVDGTETFLAMNGREFELYIVFPSTTTPAKQATSLAARLARRLILDQKMIFLSHALTWKG